MSERKKERGEEVFAMIEVADCICRVFPEKRCFCLRNKSGCANRLQEGEEEVFRAWTAKKRFNHHRYVNRGKRKRRSGIPAAGEGRD